MPSFDEQLLFGVNSRFLMREANIFATFKIFSGNNQADSLSRFELSSTPRTARIFDMAYLLKDAKVFLSYL